MVGPRLDLAVSRHGLLLPQAGPLLVAGAAPGPLPEDFGRERTVVVQPLRPEHDGWASGGWQVRPDLPETAEGRCAAALVRLPRARVAARDLIARTAAICDGPLIVDGAKTDGVETILRDLRTAGVRLFPEDGPVAKAHGKLAWFHAPDARLGGWRAADQQPAPGFVTRPGVFSADSPDPGSVLLAENLPDALGAHVVDLGAGWGWLAAAVLERATVTRLDLVEADHAALACARRAIRDPRAQFHWADARRWTPDRAPDAVIMNPPFHAGRAAEPRLGAAFVEAAARILPAQGVLWLVANRHLPYERTLTQSFAETVEIGGDTRFKVLMARKPRKPGRERTKKRTPQEQFR